MILDASPIFQRAVPPTWPWLKGFSQWIWWVFHGSPIRETRERSPFAPHDDPAEVHIHARDQDRNTIQLALYEDQKKTVPFNSFPPFILKPPQTMVFNTK